MPERYYLPLALFIFQLSACQVDDFPSDQPEQEQRLYNIDNSIRQGHYQTAQTQARQARTYYHQTLGPNSPEYAAATDALGMACYLLGKMDSFPVYFQEAYELRRNILPEDHLDMASSLNHLGLISYVAGKHEPAINEHQSALEIYNGRDTVTKDVVGQTLLYIGNAYRAMGKFPQAMSYYKEAFATLAQLSQSEIILQAEAYANIGRIFTELKDYHNAIAQIEEAMNMLTTHYDTLHPLFARFYSDLAVIEHNKENFEGAIAFQNKALKIYLATLPDDHHEIGYVYNSIGDAYQGLQNFTLARQAHEAALNVFKKTFLRKPHPSIAYTRYQLGRAYSSHGQFEAAENQLLIARALAEVVYDEHQPTVAAIHYQLGLLASRIKKFQQALAYQDQAIEVTGYDGNNLAYVNSYDWLSRPLFAKGETLYAWHKEENGVNFLDNAREYFLNADKVVSYHRKQFPEIRLHKTVTQEMYNRYEGAIRNNLELYHLRGDIKYLEEIFLWMENNHVFTLFEAIQDAKAGRFAGIPAELIKKERDLRTAIHEVNRNIYLIQQQNEADKSEKIRASRQKKKDLEEQHLTFRQQLETTYPRYAEVKNDLRTVTLAEVQAKMQQSGETLLEYFIGDSSIFLMVIGEEMMVHEIKKDFPLEAAVKTLYEFISSSPVAPTDERAFASAGKEYINLAYDLYRRLVAPVAHLLTEQIVIVPDGILHYLPFEALLTENSTEFSRFHAQEYLINQRTIRYAYSATILQEMEQKQYDQQPNDSFLGVAPGFEGSSHTTGCEQWPPLPYSLYEARELRRILDGELLLDQMATKSYFKALAPNFRLLHLATHAEANREEGELSALVFHCESGAGDPILYTSELYDLQLRADLVVLSACETGSGEWFKGEGMTGLSRGFTYAGAKSIVAGLWRVSDRSTASIMIDFYTALQQGERKATALASAKRKYFANKKGKFAHPYFWAGWLLTGDNEALF